MRGRRRCWTWRDQNWLPWGSPRLPAGACSSDWPHRSKSRLGFGIDIVYPVRRGAVAPDGPADVKDRVGGCPDGTLAGCVIPPTDTGHRGTGQIGNRQMLEAGEDLVVRILGAGGIDQLHESALRSNTSGACTGSAHVLRSERAGL